MIKVNCHLFVLAFGSNVKDNIAFAAMNIYCISYVMCLLVERGVARIVQLTVG